jgi:F-type H+-transporting ATPase subunit delta
MKLSVLSRRYAKAIYEVSVDNRTQDRVINELRALNDLIVKDQQIWGFLTSPMVSGPERVGVLQAALENKGLSKDTMDLVLLLAEKDRLALFPEIVLAYEAQSDEANGVCRGTVKSATALGQSERQRIEETVERVLKKKVIMTYKVDPTVIGGLVAQVGTFTFDDSIDSHLKRMNEELKRRTV